MMRTTRVALAALLLAGMAACDLDLQDPNRPTEDRVADDPDAVQALAIGLQAEYSNQLRDPVWVVALVTDEMGVGLSAFANYIELDAGDPIRRNFANTAAFDPWTGQYQVIQLANDVLRVTPGAPVLTEGTKSGITALAKLYKAMALGYLVQLYEELPIDVGLANPTPEFVSRSAALAEILTLLEEARTQIQTTPPSDVFRAQILAPGFDLDNTIEAMIARYALIAGNHDLAIEAAGRVDLTVLSEFRFSSVDPNPLYELWYRSGNAYQMRPERRFRLEAEEGDQRVEYWVVPDTATGAVVPLDELARYREDTDPIPVYLPDEMKLIRAEAHARRGELAQARDLINEVRTQCTSVVDEPTACLPALSEAELGTAEAIYAEILRQREYELYLQGLLYEDMRRLGASLKYDWMPVPQGECDRNPNAGC